MAAEIVNVKFVGLGGQGIVRASDLMAEVAFRAGRDVKQSELHGMSQRGGSVSSDVRWGDQVFSPMIPAGQVDYLIVLAPDQADLYRSELKPRGELLSASSVPVDRLPHTRSLNTALLGQLSQRLPFPTELWHAVLQDRFPQKYWADNQTAFTLGRTLARPLDPGGAK